MTVKQRKLNLQKDSKTSFHPELVEGFTFPPQIWFIWAMGYAIKYDEMARFISEDPIGLSGGINFYSYVGNSPLNFVDPWGLAVGDWWDLPANFQRAREIAREESEKRPLGHNNAEDAMRHAEWNRRMVLETNSFTAWVAGVGHEVEGLLDGQPWSEAMMDLYNNAVGRAAGKAGVPVDPSKLQISPQNSPSIESYPGGGCQR